MSDKKIIIRNCPAWQPHEVYYCYNSGNTRICPVYKDCILKQIVELCREENVEGEKLASIMQLSDKDTKEFLSHFASNKILELLDIEEIE